MLVDPNELEEKCMDGKLVIGMNRHREICTMQLSGNMLLFKDQVTLSKSFFICYIIWICFSKIKRCVDITANKVTKLTELIQEELNKTAADLTNDKNLSVRTSTLADKMSMI